MLCSSSNERQSVLALYMSLSLCYLWTGSSDPNSIKYATLINRSEEMCTMHQVFVKVVFFTGPVQQPFATLKGKLYKGSVKSSIKILLLASSLTTILPFFSDLEKVLQIPRA